MIILEMILFPAATFSSDELFYVAKKGDNLTTLLHRLKHVPIFGPKGSLSQTLQINPLIRKRLNSGDLLWVRDRVYFDPSHRDKISRVASILATGEIVFDSEAPTEPQNARSVAQENPEMSLPVEAAPVVVAPAVVENDFSPYSEVSGKLSQNYIRIDGDDDDGTSGALGTGATPTVELMWSPHISERFSLDFGIRYQSANFTKSDQKEIQARKQNLGASFLGLNYQASDKLRFELQAGHMDQIFYRAVDASTIKVEKVDVSYSQLALRYDFHRVKNMNFAVRGGYRIHLPFNTHYFDSSMGKGQFGSILAEHRMKDFSIVGEAFYAQDQFPVDGIDFERKELGVGVGVKYQFGKEEKVVK